MLPEIRIRIKTIKQLPILKLEFLAVHIKRISDSILNYCSSSESAALTPKPKCVFLKNVLNQEFLYNETSDFAIDPFSNQVFTWRRKSDDHLKYWASQHHEKAMGLLEKKECSLSRLLHDQVD